MKKLLTIAMMTAAVSALAAQSSNTFGILRVDSSAAQTIVSVPWEGAGASGQSANKIMVKDVVKTANLTKAGTYNEVPYMGDQLYYYANGTYKLWVLNSSGVWEGATVQKVEADGSSVTASAGTDEDPVVRGGAIILVRKNPSVPFYLYGQYTSSEMTTTCVLNGLTLLASPLTTDTDLNKCTWTNIGEGDEIYVPSSTFTTKLIRNNNQWCTKTGASTYSTKKATIPAGQGIWYKSNSTEGSDPTVTWVQVEPAQD